MIVKKSIIILLLTLIYLSLINSSKLKTKRDVKLCPNILQDPKFRLNLLYFIKRSSIIVFLLTLIIIIVIFIINLKKYKKIKEENIKLKTELDNIQMTINLLETHTHRQE
jgi:hypothetical protein